MNEIATTGSIQNNEIDWQFYLSNFLRTQNGKSYKTIKTYEGGIKAFLRFLEEKEIEKPLPDDIHDYLGYLREQGRSIFTINLYMIALKLFFGYLAKPYEIEGAETVQVYPDIYSMATPKLKRPQRKRHYRERPTEDEVRKLRRSAAHHIRDALMIDLALYCGLRVNEIANIKDTDLVKDDEDYKLFILRKGKTRKTYFVFVSSELAIRLTEYSRGITGYLFYDLSHQGAGNHLYASTVSTIISGYLKRAQIKRESITPHSLRHYAGTSFYQATKDIYATQQFLGHSDSSTTEIYMHVDDNYEKARFALAPVSLN